MVCSAASLTLDAANYQVRKGLQWLPACHATATEQIYPRQPGTALQYAQSSILVYDKSRDTSAVHAASDWNAVSLKHEAIMRCCRFGHAASGLMSKMNKHRSRLNHVSIFKPALTRGGSISVSAIPAACIQTVGPNLKYWCRSGSTWSARRTLVMAGNSPG